jgi:hypothetical protein
MILLFQILLIAAEDNDSPATKLELRTFLVKHWSPHIKLYSNVAGKVHRIQTSGCSVGKNTGGVVREYLYDIAALQEFGKFERTRIDNSIQKGGRTIYSHGPTCAFHISVRPNTLPYLHRVVTEYDVDKSIADEVRNFTGEYTSMGIQLFWPVKPLIEYLAMDGFNIEPGVHDQDKLCYMFKNNVAKESRELTGSFVLDKHHSYLIKDVTGIANDGSKIISKLEFGRVKGFDQEIPRRLSITFIDLKSQTYETEVLTWSEVSFGKTREDEFTLEHYGMKSIHDSTSKRSLIQAPTVIWGIAGIAFAVLGYCLLASMRR